MSLPVLEVMAYVDPGSLGMILYSTAVSFGLGILFFFRRIKERILGLFQAGKDGVPDVDEE